MAIRILVADDSAFWREALRANLERNSDWTVFEARDGSEAVQRSSWVHPDIAILDFRMPVLDGLNAAKELKRREPKLPIVMITVDKNSALEEEARRAGILAVFSKVDCGKVPDFVDRTLRPKAA
jgi:CheY-like chemotaxis protein